MDADPVQVSRDDRRLGDVAKVVSIQCASLVQARGELAVPNRCLDSPDHLLFLDHDLPFTLLQNLSHGGLAAFRKRFPSMKIEWMDERFTSSLARDALLAGGMKKSDRREKGAVDKVSAALILQSFLERKNNLG